jgi:hypothetical protein
LLAGNVGAIGANIPAAKRQFTDGPGYTSSGCYGAGPDFAECCDDGNRCAVVSKLGLRSAPGGSCPTGSVVTLPVQFINGKTIYHFGSMGRNVVIGPSFHNSDLSLIKRTKLSERQMIEFRWEVFDIFNHANFGQPGRTAQVGSTSFGVITNTRFPTGDSGSSRQMQFALKYKF